MSLSLPDIEAKMRSAEKLSQLTALAPINIYRMNDSVTGTIRQCNHAVVRFSQQLITGTC